METSKYAQLERELTPLKPLMEKAVDALLDQEITKYPIFVAHQHEMEIGIQLTKDVEHTLWQLHISSLEEFVSKQIIEEKKIDSFRTIYKSPEKFYCVFVLSDLGAKFLFIPRK